MLIALGTFIATVLSTAIFAVPKLMTAWNILSLKDLNDSFKSAAGVGRSEMQTGVVSKSVTATSGRSSVHHTGKVGKGSGGAGSA